MAMGGDIDECGTEGLVSDCEDGCQRETHSASTHSSASSQHGFHVGSLLKQVLFLFCLFLAFYLPLRYVSPLFSSVYTALLLCVCVFFFCFFYNCA